MKRTWMAVLMGVLLTSGVAAAKPKLLLDIWNFVAPVVSSVPTGNEIATGTIVYEASSNQFKGKDASGTWMPFNHPAGFRTSDPVAPALNEQWILHVPQVLPSALIGSVLVGAGTMELNILDPDAATVDALRTSVPGTYAISFQISSLTSQPAGTVRTHRANGFAMVPINDDAATLSEMVSEFNAWFATNLPQVGQPVLSLSNPGADGSLVPLDPGGNYALPIFLAAPGGVAESYTWKIKGAIGVFETPLTIAASP